MRIGLIDVDSSKFPNLVLMKLSAHHKSLGDNVEWYSDFNGKYDLVYMSKVFSFTPDYCYVVNADKIIKGGTGYAIKLIDGKEVYSKELDLSLPITDADKIYPDYSLYPTLTKDTAYGFITRGCPRGCDFCIVKNKEGGMSHKVADVTDFWHGQKNIVLCDPNILAYKDCIKELETLSSTGSWIDFNQGLDIRLMTEDKAGAISRCKIKEIHFAWDRYEDKNIVLPKLELFAKYSNKPHSHNTIVYTIVNFGTTIEQDLERIYTLRDMGYWAYIMIYDKQHAERKYKDLQRWVNNRFIFASCKTFEEYLKNK